MTSRWISSRSCLDRATLGVLLGALTSCADEPTLPAPCPLEDGTPPHVVDLQGNQDVFMALHSDGRAFCWGEDYAGVCGYSGGLYYGPELVPSASCLVAIAPGEVGVSLGINAQGELLVWGNEINPWEAGDGEGRGPGPEQHLVLPVRDAVSASMESHGIAIDQHGSLYYWGGLEIDVPTLYPAPGRVVTGEANHNVVCYLLDSAEVYCFGGNKFGQLGQADLSLLSYDSFLIALPLPAQKVDPGDQRACALLVNGEVWCWGSNDGDILGVPWADLPYSPVPLHVPELPVAKDLFVEGGGACILDTSDLAHCWGTAYPIPDEGTWPPRPWRPELTFKKLAVGWESVCGITMEDRLFCQGWHNGQFYEAPNPILDPPTGPNDRSGYVDFDEARRRARQRFAEEAFPSAGAE